MNQTAVATTTTTTTMMKQKQQQQQQQQQRKKKTKSVEFACNEKINQIQHIDNLSDEEKASLWYNSNELEQIREQCKKIALMAATEANKQQNNNDSNDCYDRGLELFTYESRNRYDTVVPETVHAVLKEQQRLRTIGIVYDPESLAKVTSNISKHRQRIALLTAIRDAQAIQDEQQQPSITASSNNNTNNNGNEDSPSTLRRKKRRSNTSRQAMRMERIRQAKSRRHRNASVEEVAVEESNQ